MALYAKYVESLSKLNDSAHSTTQGLDILDADQISPGVAQLTEAGQLLKEAQTLMPLA
ncbi:hypothetical protein NITHO_5160013 [Nitrolancea hollandica Lb]|uniref:Uncharacterized protein n=2 Tax=Nitrolancea hollandica TaxID=1206749 RepID=I4ELK7_9BACT|nr:hypothetical protein NITHO_5160013 [Nitrolancea hollandica Lb]